MQRIIMAILVVVGFLLAQDNPLIIRSNYLVPKAGHADKLEKGLKDHTDRFHQSEQHAINTWQVVAGNRTGQYLRTTRHRDWADFDNPIENLPGDQAHWERAVAPHVESMAGNVYWRFVPNLSYNPPQVPPKMFSVWYVQYKSGAWVAHRDALLKIIEARKENNSTAQVAAYAKAVGGEGRYYAFLNPMDGWADMNPDGMSLWETLVASYGEEEASSILGARSGAVERYESEVLLFRQDMSTPPAEE